MKPLDKLEKEMFMTMIGLSYEACEKNWYGSKDDFDIAVQNARDCAKVAVDLAKRAWDNGWKADNPDASFTNFLKEEE